MGSPSPTSARLDALAVPPPLAHDGHRARRAAWVRVIVFGGALLAAALLAYVVTLPRFTLCTFQILFGRPCPGCGMTRAIASIARGDVLASLRFHPLALPLFATAVLGLAGGVLGLTRGRDPLWELVERRGTWLAVGLMAAMLGLWIVRGFVVPEWSPDPVGRPGAALRGPTTR